MYTPIASVNILVSEKKCNVPVQQSFWLRAQQQSESISCHRSEPWQWNLLRMSLLKEERLRCGM